MLSMLKPTILKSVASHIAKIRNPWRVYVKYALDFDGGIQSVRRWLDKRIIVNKHVHMLKIKRLL